MKNLRKYNEAQLAEITRYQEQHNTTRATAIRKLGKKLRELAKQPKQINPQPPVNSPEFTQNSSETQPPVTAEPQAPKPEAEASKPAKAKKEPKPAPVKLTSDQVSNARAEGLRLFALAGKPKKADFLRVYGEKGARWTWADRAKAKGYASAEEAAQRFQADLAEETGTELIVVETTTDQTPATSGKAAKKTTPVKDVKMAAAHDRD